MSQFLAELYAACVVEHARENVDGILKGPFYVIGKEARDAFNLPYDATIFKRVIEILEYLGALTIYRNPGMQSYYRLEVKKFDEVMKVSTLVRNYMMISPFEENSPTYSFLESYADLGSDFLMDALSAHADELNEIGDNGEFLDEATASEFSSDQSKPKDEVPASDRYVDFTHNEEAVIEAHERVAKAEEVVRQSNTLAPELRSLWGNLISQGREYLKKPGTYIAVISALLLKPLYDAYSSSIEESAKPLIDAAIIAIKALIGL